MQTVEIEPLKAEEPLAKDFVDNSYWKKDLEVGSIDDLLADYEWRDSLQSASISKQ